MPEPAGLLLLTGGRSRRFGAAKHDQPHPAGGTWGAHLVKVFTTLFPAGPIQLLGEPLSDRPDLLPQPDPRQGPAVALRHWSASAAARQGGQPLRWWVLPCDQPRWTPAALAEWHQQVTAADPQAHHWALAIHHGSLQPLGGFLPSSLLPRLAQTQGTSLMALTQSLPTLLLPSPMDVWQDVDTPEALSHYLRPPLP